MKFLVDVGVGKKVENWLKENSFDVLSVRDIDSRAGLFGGHNTKYPRNNNNNRYYVPRISPNIPKGCGRMAVDNSCTRITGEESEHPPLTSCSQNRSLLKNRKSGQLICYKNGQFYLLLTIAQYFLDTQVRSAYTSPVKKQYLIRKNFVSRRILIMMQAARFYAKGEPLKLEEVPIPEIGADEVLVKVAGCGICQSDLEYIDLGVPTVKKPPITLGHEPAGTITKIGESVKGFKVGDTVLCSNIISCGVCRYCREGRDDICDNWVMLGNMIDGAYAQYVKIPAKNAYLLPPEIDPEYGCIIADAVSTPFHAVKDRSGLRIGDNVALFGCGGLGMAAIQIATAMGGNVIAVDVFDAKLEIARKMGAVETINSRTTDAVKEIRRLTSGRGVDVAFEMIGRPETIVQAYKSVAKGGRLVQVGFSPKEVTLNLGRMMINEIEVVGSCACRSVDFPRLIELIRRGKIDIKSLVTHKFPLSQVNEALDVLRRGESIRVVLTPNK